MKSTDMREIKFRAYNKKLRKMFKWEEIDGRLWAQFFNGVLGDFKIMQFTGLSDKNGKEIYEGDIYKRKVFAECHCGGRLMNYIIRYNHSSFGLVPHCNTGTNPLPLGSKYNLENGEVVGNIYENPELL